MEEEREGEKHPCVVDSLTPATGDLAHNPGMCPDWELNERPFGSQAGAQSSEPTSQGSYCKISECLFNVGWNINYNQVFLWAHCLDIWAPVQMKNWDAYFGIRKMHVYI